MSLLGGDDTLVDRRSDIAGLEEDALREVLAMERQAQGIIQDAEAEGHRLVTEARQRAQQMRQIADDEIQNATTASLSQAEEEMKQEVAAIEHEAQMEADAWLAAGEKRFAEALSYVLAAVTMGEIS